MKELSRRLSNTGINHNIKYINEKNIACLITEVTANSLHPGVVQTEIHKKSHALIPRYWMRFIAYYYGIVSLHKVCIHYLWIIMNCYRVQN